MRTAFLEPDVAIRFKMERDSRGQTKITSDRWHSKPPHRDRFRRASQIFVAIAEELKLGVETGRIKAWKYDRSTGQKELIDYGAFSAQSSSIFFFGRIRWPQPERRSALAFVLIEKPGLATLLEPKPAKVPPAPDHRRVSALPIVKASVPEIADQMRKMAHFKKDDLFSVILSALSASHLKHITKRQFDEVWASLVDKGVVRGAGRYFLGTLFATPDQQTELRDFVTKLLIDLSAASLHVNDPSADLQHSSALPNGTAGGAIVLSHDEPSST